MDTRQIGIPAGDVTLEGDLVLPPGARGVVLFAHGSGSSRHSPRNQFVARELQRAGLGTLLIDLLSVEEEQAERITRHLRFDIGLLASRLTAAVDWLASGPSTASLRVGMFGASTGGGAALVAAARRPERVAAVVSRGGRPDLAGEALPHVSAPTLLLVGGFDMPVITMNQDARAQMPPETITRLTIVPGATHLFEEPGTLEDVAAQAAAWFREYLTEPGPPLDQSQPSLESSTDVIG
jgi:putative phosphoribosyl transferase